MASREKKYISSAFVSVMTIYTQKFCRECQIMKNIIQYSQSPRHFRAALRFADEMGIIIILI